MKLTEFNNKPGQMAKKALKENFNTTANFEKLSLSETKNMLTKVKTLIKETKESTRVHQSEQNPAYLKLIFMEQALLHHYGDLKARPIYNARIVVENEGVEQAQVVLAAKDMIDTVQKMIENISDILVKELPAVVDSVNSEIGTNEGEQFNGQATEALSTLGTALQQAKVGLQSAMNIVTGQEAGAVFGAEAGDMGMGEMPMEPEAEMSDMEPSAEMPEEPEEMSAPSIGRGKRK